MLLEQNVSLKPLNSFALPATAAHLVRVQSESELRAVIDHPVLGPGPKLILGGGSNIIFTQDPQPCVLKIEIKGKRVLHVDAHAAIIEVGAGECWHEVVAWSLEQGLPGLENLALIPGTVGAAPVQNIGAYGLELQDRFESLDAIDLVTGRKVTLDQALCHFDYRDSIFKHELKGKSVITQVRLRLPRPWQPVLGYLDIERKMQECGVTRPSAQQLFNWICEIRRAKLPDPLDLGNVGSFFKNPVVSPEQCQDIIGRDPEIVHYPMPDGSVKLAAGWLIDACGWRGKSIGRAGVYDKQALVLVNHGGASGAEVLTLARAIQESVYGRFGIRLEPEPLVL